MRPEPRLLLAVAGGGAMGALLRHALGSWVPDGQGFPWTTFAINLCGSAALAGLASLGAVRRSPAWAALLGPGLLGGFTTMSAASEQARSLLAGGDGWLGVAYLLGSAIACVVGVVLVHRLAPVAAAGPGQVVDT